MWIEHIISTMFQENTDFLHRMKCQADVLVVNQASDVQYVQEEYQGHKIRMYTVPDRGLSNSRNALLEHVQGEIAILGDDDLIYLDGYLGKIQKAYQEHPEADIIAFSFTQSLNEDTRRQFQTARKLNLITISKVASVELTFRIKSIADAGLSFCPFLGLGAKYGACEENAFLADALRAGLKIWYVPETICYLQPDPPERVKWQNGFDRDYFVKRGACFYRIYKSLFVPFSAAFLILKKRNIFRHISLLNAFSWMREGRKMYINDEENQKCS